MKALSRSVICNWVKNSWDSIPSDTIKNSFKSYAITTALDGSEDSSIHSFKKGQPCGRGKDVLAERMANLDLPMEDDSDLCDPFASDNDEEKMENNEVCIEADDAGDDLPVADV